ncbi:MAG: outer membrane beta-barrel protein [Myxococcales bacterium]|nr:outer membrane beta-barrel protein [Myxococcales bacterium]MDD9965247.1 outer membrane beta-barrel protein [Myxococcales bacterium]
MRTLSLLFGGLAVLLLTSSAQADTLPRLYVGILGGISANTDDVPEGAPDPWGPALGARAGLTIPTTDIYVGGMVLYHFGISPDLPDTGVAEIDISGNTLLLSAEGGYEWKLGPLILRPSLGLGFADQSLSVSGGAAGFAVSGDTSESSFYLSPGLNAMLSLFVLVGAEVRYNALFNSNTANSVSVLGTLGFSI